MGAIHFIDSNPTTAQVDVNLRNDLAAASTANSLLTARDARVEKRLADENAAIAAEAMTRPRSPLAAVAPAEPQMYDEFGTPTKATALAKATPGATIPQAPVAAPAAAGRHDPYANAMEALRGRQGAGAMQFQLAQAKLKESQAAHAEAIKAFGAGDFELAQALNQQHGLGLDSVFSNPSALQTSKMIAGSIAHMKMEPAQSIAYMDAATKRFSEVYGQTKNMREAMNAAGQAGMTAARGTRTKAEKFLETPNGYYDPSTGQYETDSSGKVVKVPDRRLFFNPHGGAGAGGGTPKAVATMEWKAEAYKALGVEPNLAKAIAANPGFATTPQAVQKQAQFIVNASKDVMGRPTKTMQQATAEAQNLMRQSQKVAVDAMSGQAADQPAPSAAPAGRVRKYIPGQGFVDQ